MQNAPRTLTPADFAGGRYFVIAPGINTPCRLVIGRPLAALAPLGRGCRVLLDLPELAGEPGSPALTAFDGGQIFKVIEHG